MAVQALQPFALPNTADNDPVWRAVLAAPIGAPETEEERNAFEALLIDVRAGRRGVRRDVVLSTLEKMRVEQGDGEAP